MSQLLTTPPALPVPRRNDGILTTQRRESPAEIRRESSSSFRQSLRDASESSRIDRAAPREDVDSTDDATPIDETSSNRGDTRTGDTASTNVESGSDDKRPDEAASAASTDDHESVSSEGNDASNDAAGVASSAIPAKTATGTTPADASVVENVASGDRHARTNDVTTPLADREGRVSSDVDRVHAEQTALEGGSQAAAGDDDRHNVASTSTSEATVGATPGEATQRVAGATTPEVGEPVNRTSRPATRDVRSGSTSLTTTSSASTPPTEEDADQPSAYRTSTTPTDAARDAAKTSSSPRIAVEPEPVRAETPALGRVADVEASVRNTATPSTANTLTTSTIESNTTTLTPSADRTTAASTTMTAGERLVNAKLDEQAFSQRLVRGLQSVVNQKGGTLNMRLTPAELGTVRISMTIVRDVVSAQFIAQTSEAQAMLDKHIGTLKTTLEQQGLTVERLHVQSSSSTSTTQQQTNGQSDRETGGDANDGRSRGQRDHQDSRDPDGSNTGRRSFASAFQQGQRHIDTE